MRQLSARGADLTADLRIVQDLIRRRGWAWMARRTLDPRMAPGIAGSFILTNDLRLVRGLMTRRGIAWFSKWVKMAEGTEPGQPFDVDAAMAKELRGAAVVADNVPDPRD